jgi:hypothetical protein
MVHLGHFFANQRVSKSLRATGIIALSVISPGKILPSIVQTILARREDGMSTMNLLRIEQTEQTSKDVAGGEEV